MDYDKIIIDLLNRIVTLEERVAKLENRNTSPECSELPAGSKKYRFLSDYLYESNQSQVKLTFAEIERILKFKLPDSATTHRAFWANTESHSIALSWLSVNYSVVEANLGEKYIVFEKKRKFDNRPLEGVKNMSIETIWDNIKLHEGETFYTITGVEYTYVVYTDHLLVNDLQSRMITKIMIEKAIALENPTVKKIELAGCRGPSYIWGIITDKRIIGA